MANLIVKTEKVEVKTFVDQKSYTLTLSEKEAKYITALLGLTCGLGQIGYGMYKTLIHEFNHSVNGSDFFENHSGPVVEKKLD